MKKRHILIFLTVLFLSVIIRNNGSASAAENPTISVNYIEAAAGQEVTLSVKIDNNPGICTIRLAIHYDPWLTLVKVTDSGLFKESIFGGDTNSNPYYIMWDESLASENNKGNGALASLTFKVNDGAPAGNYRVWLTYEKGDVFNLDLDDVDFNLTEGGVKIPDNKNQSDPINSGNNNSNSSDNGTNNNTYNNNSGNNSSDNNNTDNNNSKKDTKNDTGNEKTEDVKQKTDKFTVITTGSDSKKITAKYTVAAVENTDPDGTKHVILTSLKTSTTDVTIPDMVENDNITYTVDSIAQKALKSNKKVKSLTIGENITTIGSYAFKGMKKLKSITIYSDSLKEVGEGAFSGIYKKATIKIKAGKKAYKKIVTLIKASGIGEKVTFKRIK